MKLLALGFSLPWRSPELPACLESVASLYIKADCQSPLPVRGIPELVGELGVVFDLHKVIGVVPDVCGVGIDLPEVIRVVFDLHKVIGVVHDLSGGFLDLHKVN